MLSDSSIKLIAWLIESASLKPADPNFGQIAQAFEQLKAELKQLSGVKSARLNGSHLQESEVKMEEAIHPNTAQ